MNYYSCLKSTFPRGGEEEKVNTKQEINSCHVLGSFWSLKKLKVQVMIFLFWKKKDTRGEELYGFSVGWKVPVD